MVQRVNVVFEAVDKTKKAFASVQASMGKVRSAAFSVGGALAAIATSAAATKIVSANQTYQSLQASLVTFTGSAEAAADQFAKLQQFAATTPFALDEVVGGFNKLVARGIEPTLESFGAFGNIASGTGKTLDQFVEAVADAAVGEFERLKEFGIKANVEGDKVRVTFGGVTKQISRDSTAILSYLEELGQTKFGGAIDRQAQTLTGAFSNFGDAVDSLAVAIGNSGLNKWIIENTRSLTAFISRLQRATQEGYGLAEAIKYAFTGGYADEQQRIEQLEKIRQKIKQVQRTIAGEEALTTGASTAMTDEQEMLRILQDQEKVLLGIEKINSRGRGFIDPRRLGKVGSIVSQEQEANKPIEEARKKLEEETKRIKKLLDKAYGVEIKQKASDFAKTLEILNKRFFDGVLSAKEYDDAVARLAGTVQVAGDAAEDLSDSLGYAAEIREAVAGLITDNDVTQADAYAKKLELLDKMFFDGSIDANVYDAALKKLANTTEVSGEKGKNALLDYAKAAQDVGAQMMNLKMGAIKTIEDGFVDLITGTKNVADAFRSMAQSVISSLARMWVQQSITGPIAGVLGLTGKAIGGPVQAGKPYMVGERGPEMFVPNQSGSIIPNSSGGGGVTVVQNINLSTGVQQTVRAEVMSMMPQIANAAKSAVADAKLRGGSYAAALR